MTDIDTFSFLESIDRVKCREAGIDYEFYKEIEEEMYFEDLIKHYDRHL